MHELLSKIGSIIVAPLLALSSIFFPAPAAQPVEQAPVENLGASNTIPTAVALFETSLASKISSTATSMTLVSALDKTGTALASSTYGFIIDEGTAQEEMVLADCTGTTCTNMVRGISPLTGNTSVTALEFEHRRGASVKITNGPQILILSRILNGDQAAPNPLSYESGVAIGDFTSSQSIVDRGYVDSLAFGAVPAASESASGFVELATQAENAASGATGGSGAKLVIQSKNATSTWSNFISGAGIIPTTGISGKLDKNFLDLSSLATTTFSGNISLSGTATSTIASSTIAAYAATSTSFSPTWTWTKPANVKYVDVTVVGGGGGAGKNSSSPPGATSGGGGGYARSLIPASALTSTVTITAGKGGAAAVSAGAGTAGANSSFGSYVIGNGGGAGQGSNSGGGGGGSGTGDIVLAGEDGLNSISGAVTVGGNAGGNFGMGGGYNSSYMSGHKYGGGGAGASDTGGGGSGAPGIVIVQTYFY